MRTLIACGLILGLWAGPIRACINDSELPSHEREFRAQYARKGRPASKPKGETARYWILGGAGVAMLTGGAAMALVGRRSKK